MRGGGAARRSRARPPGAACRSRARLAPLASPATHRAHHAGLPHRLRGIKVPGNNSDAPVLLWDDKANCKSPHLEPVRQPHIVFNAFTSRFFSREMVPPVGSYFAKIAYETLIQTDEAFQRELAVRPVMFGWLPRLSTAHCVLRCLPFPLQEPNCKETFDTRVADRLRASCEDLTGRPAVVIVAEGVFDGVKRHTPVLIKLEVRGSCDAGATA